MTVTHQLFIPERAEADLDAIYRHIAGASGQTRAGTIVDSILKQCRGLDLFPRRGTPRDDLFPGLRGIAHRDRASVALTVEGSLVTIEAVAWRGRDLAAGSSRNR